LVYNKKNDKSACGGFVGFMRIRKIGNIAKCECLAQIGMECIIKFLKKDLLGWNVEVLYLRNNNKPWKKTIRDCFITSEKCKNFSIEDLLDL
jgi:hypothetical protein